MNFLTMIKPASSSCNMNCSYCFYNDVADNRHLKDYGTMSLESLEVVVKKTFETGAKNITFAFQGGEPTLVGLEFYKTLIVYVEKYNVKDSTVAYALQTNGYNLDHHWAAFFKEHNFLVGVSLDGPKEIHNKNRRGRGDVDSFNRVMKTIQTLKKHEVTFNILTVVTNTTAKHPLKVYNFFKKNGFNYLQFIPCIDPFDEASTFDKGLTPELYGVFLKKIFDLWYEDVMNDRLISIRYFDNLISILAGYAPESCDMKGVCSVIPIIEADGSVYPCDFYVLDEWYLGNIKTEGFEVLMESERANRFIESSEKLYDACKTCSVYALCRGGCRRNRVNDQNIFCQSYKTFYPYAYLKLMEIIHKKLRRP